MNTAALITLVATILSTEGSFIQVDVGSSAGLRVGDPGIAFYELATADGVDLIDVGLATVIAVTDDRAALRLAPGGAVEVDHLVRFEISEDRLGEAPPPPAAVIGSARVEVNLGPCLRIRELPGTFSRSLDCLEPGSRVDLLTSAGEWTRVRLPDRREGWLATRFLVSSRNLPGTYEGGGYSDDLASRLAEVEAVLQDSERARLELLGSLEERPAEIDEIEGSGNENLDLADSSIRQLRQQLLQSESEFDSAQRSHQDLSQRVVESTVGTLEKRLEEAQTVARNAEISRRRLADEVSDLAQENDSLRLRLATAETLRDEAEEARRRLQTELDFLQPISPAEREMMVAEAEYRKAEIERSRMALEQAERRILELEREVEELKGPSDVEPEKTRRRPKWKFWKWWRSSDEDTMDASDAEESSDVDSGAP